MPNIFRNYRIKKGQVILLDPDCVLTELPICIAELDKEYEKPILIDLENNMKLAVEEMEYLEMQAKQLEHASKFRNYKLLINTEDGSISEAVTEDEVKRSIDCELPIDIDLTTLIYENGEVKLNG